MNGSAPLYQSPVDIHVSIYKTLTCKGAVYDRHRRKKGYRGIGHPQRSGGRPAAWLRTGTAHRIANQRRFELQPRRSLSHALSHGAAPVDSRRLGNWRERTPPPLLSADSRWKETAFTAPRGVVGTFQRAAQPHQGLPCVIGI